MMEDIRYKEDTVRVGKVCGTTTYDSYIVYKNPKGVQIGCGRLKLTPREATKLLDIFKRLRATKLTSSEQELLSKVKIVSTMHGVNLDEISTKRLEKYLSFDLPSKPKQAKVKNGIAKLVATGKIPTSRLTRTTNGRVKKVVTAPKKVTKKVASKGKK